MAQGARAFDGVIGARLMAKGNSGTLVLAHQRHGWVVSIGGLCLDALVTTTGRTGRPPKQPRRRRPISIEALPSPSSKVPRELLKTTPATREPFVPGVTSRFTR